MWTALSQSHLKVRGTIGVVNDSIPAALALNCLSYLPRSVLHSARLTSGILRIRAADQEAERERAEHRDGQFEQRVERLHMQRIGKPDQHHGMDQVECVHTGC